MKSAEYLEELFYDGKRCFDDLDSDQAAKLSGLLISEGNKCAQFEFITENVIADQIPDDLAAYMKSFVDGDLDGHKDAAANLLKTLVAGASAYGKYFIEEMFEKRIAMEREYDYEKGIRHVYNHERAAA